METKSKKGTIDAKGKAHLIACDRTVDSQLNGVFGNAGKVLPDASIVSGVVAANRFNGQHTAP